MSLEYETTINGMEYIIYNEPIELSRVEIPIKYSYGGFIITKRGKHSTDIRGLLRSI